MIPKRRDIWSAVVYGIVLTMVLLNISLNSSEADQLGQDMNITETQHSDRAMVHLYFSDRKNLFLIAEERNLVHFGNPNKLGSGIVTALIEGPRTGFMRTIPANTILKAFYISQDGIAYVDMSAAIKDAHPGGIKSELFTIYSIVNSLMLNVPEIDAVKILIDGREAMTLSGHVDLRFPFKANMLLIR